MTCGRDADDVKTVWRVEWHPARATVCVIGTRVSNQRFMIICSERQRRVPEGDKATMNSG
jgi:hypothetical protein